MPAPNRTGAVGSTNPTPVVIALVVINAVVFVASGFGKTSVIDRFGMWPNGVHYQHQYYRLFDAIFLHLSFLHIASNMITLLIVGPAVEVMLGKARFLALYLLAGLGGNVLAYLIAPANQVGAGASGAIFGVMGAYVVLARLRHKPMGAGRRPDRDQPGHRLHRQHRVAGPHRRIADRCGAGAGLPLRLDPAQPGGRTLPSRWGQAPPPSRCSRCSW